MITELPPYISRLVVQRAIVTTSKLLLEQYRTAKVEACILWYGTVAADGVCTVSRCICPEQQNNVASYAISAQSMREVRKVVRGEGLLLLAQIHTHPRNAFFSEWDELNALNKRVGALNMVLPDYGNVPWIDAKRFCMVEMDSTGNWCPWSAKQWERLQIVEDDPANHGKH